MPYLMGNRADNEAVLNDNFDMTKVKEFLEKKNSENPEHNYTYFHIILAALAKVFYLRPKMNIFIAGHRYYMRDDISFSFVAKNKFADNGGESLLIIKAEDNDQPIVDQLHDKICAEVYKVREGGGEDGTTTNLKWLSRIPRPILKVVVKLLFWMNYHDLIPASLNDFDPYRSSIFVSNLGSIKMDATYHHLINWSLNSCFVLINQVHMAPFFADDGSYQMKPSCNIGFTIDERIADGFYFARSIMLFRYLLENPELLEQPLSAPVDWEEK